MGFRYVGYRFHMRFSFPFDTLKEAIEAAAGNADNGDAAYLQIENEDGSIALDKDALGKAIHEQWDRWDAAEAASNQKTAG